ncbi:MAG: helix-turn-helix transcriptional regulator [Treponema sp.]|nr:helix-turn-helix transcriptional regulator [Treponema sp.]MBR4246712.1 helix-turn-helix transcriptional regulator [Treponema sp.]
MSLERTVIDNIKRIRKEKGITQEQLAEACNTATSYIGLMEIYKNVPKLSTIERIATALGVEPQILFQKPELDKESENKIEKIKEAVMSALEKELVHSLREVI